MVKQLRKLYEYHGRLLNLRKLFQAIPDKKRGDIICSAVVKTKKGILCKIVFIRNRNCKRDYLAILLKDISRDDCEIVRLYARRWLIETCFTVPKDYFKLGTESYARDFDNMIAFISVASIRFIMKEFFEDTRKMSVLLEPYSGIPKSSFRIFLIMRR